MLALPPLLAVYYMWAGSDPYGSQSPAMIILAKAGQEGDGWVAAHTRTKSPPCSMTSARIRPPLAAWLAGRAAWRSSPVKAPNELARQHAFA